MPGEIRIKKSKNMFKKNPKKEKLEKSACSKVGTSSFASKPAGRRGISFIETLIAIAIFSLVIMVATSVAAVYLRNRKIINQYQEASEELSLVLNYVSKDLRTSNNCDEGPSLCSLPANQQTEIAVRSNRDSTSYTRYEFDNTNNRLLRLATENGVVNNAVVATDVKGYFYVSGAEIKRITIVIWKIDRPDRTFQTTVSMRSGYGDFD